MTYSFISIQLLGRFGRNQSPERRPVWLWHTTSWASFLGVGCHYFPPVWLIKIHKITLRYYGETSKGTDFTMTVDQMHFNVYYQQPSGNGIYAVCFNPYPANVENMVSS